MAHTDDAAWFVPSSVSPQKSLRESSDEWSVAPVIRVWSCPYQCQPVTLTDDDLIHHWSCAWWSDHPNAVPF